MDMGQCFAALSDSDFSPNPEDGIMKALFSQYERVIVESLITSFGLDFLIKDRHGGDVDTIHNVRQTTDGKMEYKNRENQAAYDSRGDYNAAEYHQKDNRYTDKRAEYAAQKQANNLYDEYIGEKFDVNDKVDVEHIISAKEIHNDPGRTLAGIRGVDLANSDDNLCATNAHTNRSKQDDSVNEFLDKRGAGYTDEQKEKIRAVDARARKAYEAKLAAAYYSSAGFAKDTAKAAGKVGIQMGLRQVVGLMFTEVWFSVREEFSHISTPFELEELYISIGNGIKRGFINAKHKYKDLIDKFKEGAIAGVLSNITTTLCNIFFTTAKNTIRIMRQAYASIVQAAEILFLNPENLAFGERMRAASKILATGASIVIGVVVTEAVGDTGIKSIPVLANIIPDFCGALVTGIMTCSFLVYLDRSKTMNHLVSVLNSIPSVSSEVDYYKRQATYFKRYAAELIRIDLQQFIDEEKVFSEFACRLNNVQDGTELNALLKDAVQKIGIKIPWGDDFNSLMNDKSKVLIFE